MEDICEVSNPELVLKQLKKYYGNKVYLFTIFKKYMVFNEDGKKIHFGSIIHEDYTKHKDKKRRDNFRTRNKKWKDADKYTPAHLSYYLLW